MTYTKQYITTLFLFYLVIILVSCESPVYKRIGTTKRENPELVFEHVQLTHNFYRLENSEVICYYNNRGTQCKFKKGK